MYCVYVLLCRDRSLYTGISNDLNRRLAMHAKGSGSKYVRSRLPFKLVYFEAQLDHSRALVREAEIKNWNRQEKVERLQLELQSDNGIIY